MSEYVGDNAVAIRPRGVGLGLPDPASLIPESSPYDPWWQKAADVASMPAREAVHGVATALGAGAEAFTRSMQGNVLTDPQARQDITMATLGLGAKGLVTEAEGPGAFAAWHGSRHLFEPEPGAPLGRFREEAMSTGEGAQAYAWGHYVAGKRSVAEQYKTAGAMPGEKDPVTHVDGQPVLNMVGGDPPPGSFDYEAAPEHMQYAISSYHDNGGDIHRAIANLQGNAESHRHNADYYERMGGDENSPAQQKSRLSAIWAENNEKGAQWLEDYGHRLETRKPGNLYQVWIRPEHEDLLDWDKHLDEQPPDVRNKLLMNFPGIAARYAEDPQDPYLRGSEIYRSIAHGSRPGVPGISFRGDQGASEALDSAGIPGTKFLDGFSRGLPKVLSLDGKQWNVKSDTPELLAMNMIASGPTPLNKLRGWSLNDNVDWAMNELGKDMDSGIYRNSMAFSRPSSEFKEGEFVPTDHATQTQETHDWLRDNRQRLSMGDHPNATSNYVMFHHRHLGIIDRNGQRYGFEPVDHDPFATP